MHVTERSPQVLLSDTPHRSDLLLLINPNSNTDTTSMMQTLAQEYFRKDSLRVVGITTVATELFKSNGANVS